MFLLDTNVVSELRKSARRKSEPNVVAWISRVDVADLYLSAISLMEIEMGILRIERHDPDQARRLRDWMENQVLREFSKRILDVDAVVALRCAPLHVPDPKPERDAFIAATALVHGMTVVTRNVADFVPMGVPLLNPWEPLAS